MKDKKLFDTLTQIAIPLFTLGGQLAIALKYPGEGFILMLLAQPFWLYSSYIAYKKAGQIGMLLTTIAFTVISAIGVMNYWVL